MCIMQQNVMARNLQSKCTKLQFSFLSKSNGVPSQVTNTCCNSKGCFKIQAFNTMSLNNLLASGKGKN